MAKNNGGKFALGALIAGAVGYVAGILTAPKSGKETRADLKRKATEIKDEASKRVNSAKNEAAKKGNELKDQADELVERAGNAIEGAKEGFAKKPLGRK